MTDVGALEIRPGRESDLPALVDIYNHYVRETHVTFDVEPYTVESRGGWFGEFAMSGPYRLLVAEVGDAVVGYSHSQRLRPKKAYETSVETTVYLKAGFQGRGLGRALYEMLFDALQGEDIHRAYGIVAQPNEASNALHRKLGFRPVAHLTEVGRKFGKYFDVIWFERVFEAQRGETAYGSRGGR